MATKVGSPKKKKAVKKARKATRENPGPTPEAGAGHNVAALRETGEALVEEFIALSDSMESDMAGYRSDFNNLYEKCANETGLKKAVITKELKRILANKKAVEKEKAMAADERAQTELWRTAMIGTQFQMFAEGDLAQPEAGGDLAESEEEGSEE